MNTALVYDRINKYGGAERVLEELHALYPLAPVYTSVYDPDGAPWAKGWDIRPSFLSTIPFARSRHELLPLLTPFAFETFNFDGMDVVISVTSSDAKAVITKPQTCHICYCLTPTRYLWSGIDEYQKHPSLGTLSGIGGKIFQYATPMLQRWDKLFSRRPDYFVAISKLVAKRIKKYYGIQSDKIIYPPVDTMSFVPSEKVSGRDYFLTVARLVPYKRIDIVAQAATKLGVRLVIIGSGYDEARIRSCSGDTVTLITEKLTDEKLTEYYQQCRAFVYAGQEDFGIAAAEAQSCGKPVIAYTNSGIAEIVQDGKTGVLFDTQSVESLIGAIKKFETMTFSPQTCRENALRFSSERFQVEMKDYIVQTVHRYRRDIMV